MPSILDLIQKNSQEESRQGQVDNSLNQKNNLQVDKEEPQEPEMSEGQKAYISKGYGSQDPVAKQNQGNTIELNPEEIEAGRNGEGQEPNQELGLTPDEIAQQRIAQIYTPLQYEASKNVLHDSPETWTPEYTQMGFITKTVKNLGKGIGEQVVGGFGDVAQFLNGPIPNMDIAEGNVISRFFQDIGQQMSDSMGEVYMLPEIRDPKFNLNTFMTPDFWSGHAAKLLPNMLEFIFLSHGASALAKGGAKRAAKRYATKNAGKVAKKGRQVSENIVEQVAKGADEILTEIPKTGKGVLGKLLTTRGGLTSFGEQAAQMVGGGFTMNTLVGLQNASELVNTERENGNYTNDEIAEMAALTMAHNMKWMGVDMISWGVTYTKGTGRGTRAINKLKHKIVPKGNASGKRFFGKDQQMIIGALSFNNRVKPVTKMLKRVAKAGGKPLFEGTEEMFQETWEEWSKKRAKEQVSGISDGYDESLGGYMDFFLSKENEATRTIAFALGAIGGSIGNTMNYINKAAEEEYKLANRSELIKHRVADNNRGALEVQQTALREILIDNMLSEDAIDNVEFIKTMEQYETVTPEEAEQMYAINEELQKDYASAEAMNIKGKATFLQAKSRIAINKQNIDTQQGLFKERIAGINEAVQDPRAKEKKIQEETEAHEKLIKALQTEVLFDEQNIENIILGKEAFESNTKTLRDENGNVIAVNLGKEAYDDYYNKTNEEILAEARKNRPKKEESKSFRERLKSFFSKEEEKKGEKPEDNIKVFKGMGDIFNQNPESEEGLGEEYSESVQKQEPLRQFTTSNIVEADKAYKDAFGKSALPENYEELSAEQKKAAIEEANASVDNFNQRLTKEKAKYTKENKPATTDETDDGFEATEDNEEATEEAPIELTQEQVEDIQKRFNVSISENKDGSLNISGDGDINGASNAINKILFPNGQTDESQAEQKTDQKTEPKAKPKEKTAEEKAEEQKLIEEELKNIYNENVLNTNTLEANLIEAIYGSTSDEEITQDEVDAYLSLSKMELTVGVTNLDRARVLNNHLKALFPDQKIQAYAFRNLVLALGGEQALGYALGSAILIDDKVWNQEDIYMHEFAHIYYAANPNSEEVKELISKARRNRKLIQGLYQDYKDDIKYEYTSGLNKGKTFYGRSKNNTDLKLMLDQNLAKELPEERQDIILEEAFVNMLQGPMSKKYSKYFDLKSESLRQARAKTFWGRVKARSERAKLTNKRLQEKLNEGTPNTFRSNEERIMSNFVESMKGKDVTSVGRRSAGRSYSIRQLQGQEKIKEMHNKEVKGLRALGTPLFDAVAQADLAREQKAQGVYEPDEDGPIINIDEDEPINPNMQVDDDALSLVEEAEINPYEKRYEYQETRIAKNISYFIEEENKRENRERLKSAEQGIPKGRRSPYKLKDFKDKLTQMAVEEPYYAEYVRSLVESENEQVKRFVKYMQDNNSSDWVSKLISAHFIFTNSVVVNTKTHMVGEKGDYISNIGLSTNEALNIENISGQIIKDEDIVAEAINRIKQSQDINVELTPEESKAIIYAYSNSYLEPDIMMSKDTLRIDGNNYSIEGGINYAVKKGYLDVQEDGDYLRLSRNTRFIEVLTESSRPYSSLSVIEGPSGNMMSSRMTNFLLNKLVAEVNQDLSQMSRDEFVKKHSLRPKDAQRAIRDAKSVGTKLGEAYLGSNELAARWWDNYHNLGIKPNITMDLGDINLINNIRTDFKNSTARQQMLNETLAFLSNYQEQTYDGSMDIFGDSSRKFGLSVPMYKEQLFNRDNTLTANGEVLLKNAYGIYLATRTKEDSPNYDDFMRQNPLISYDTFKNGFYKSVKTWKEYLTKNAVDFSSVTQFRNLYKTDKEGVVLHELTPMAEQQMNEFLYNRIINSFNIQQMFRPGISLDARVKRNKTLIAPVMALHKNLRPEKIFVPNEYKYRDGRMVQNDSGQFILSSVGDAIRKRTNGSLDLGHGFKLYSGAIERDNPNWQGQSIMMKGYTTELNDENTRPGGSQQAHRPYYEILIAQKEKFIKWWKEQPQNEGRDYIEEDIFLEDPNSLNPVYMGIITPVTAEKAELLTRKNIEGINAFGTLDQLGTKTGRLVYEKILDKMYYSKGQYIGTNGSNFGPQQVMDKENNRAKFSIQAMSSPLVNQKGDKLKRALKAQEYLRQQKMKVLRKKILSKIEGPWDQAFTKLIIDTANLKDSDAFSILQFIDKNINALPYSPATGTWSLDQIRKLIINNGNNLTVDGTYGQTISDLGYTFTNKQGEPRFSARGDSDGNALQDSTVKRRGRLQGYRVGIDGRTIAFEGLLPQSQQKSGVRARELFDVSTLGNAKTAKAAVTAKLNNDKELRNELGFRKQVVDERTALTKKTAEISNYGTPKVAENFENLSDFVEQFKYYDEDGNVAGYYIPGENVLTTRIPHNGPAFMGVMEVVGFTTSGASSIVVPSEYKNIIGSDDDGDALFVYRKSQSEFYSDWNKAFDIMVDQWLSPEMRETLDTELDFEEDTNLSLDIINAELESNQPLKDLIATYQASEQTEEDKKAYKEGRKNVVKNQEFQIPFGVEEFESNFNNSVVSRSTVGIAFQATRAMNQIAPYRPRLHVRSKEGVASPVEITLRGGRQVGRQTSKGLITDRGSGKTSRVQKNTVQGNRVLDSTKNKHADGLYYNPATIMSAVILEAVGFSTEAVGLLMNHPISKKYYSELLDSRNGYIPRQSEQQVIKKLRLENKVLNEEYYKNRASFEIQLFSPKSPEYRSEANEAQIIQLLSWLHKVSNDFSKINNITNGHKDISRNPIVLEQQIDALKKFINNQDETSTIIFEEREPELSISNNPELNSYLDVAQEFIKIQKRINLVFNDNVRSVLDFVKAEITIGDLTNTQIEHFTELLKPFLYSRFLGINNIPSKTIQAMFSKNGSKKLNIVQDINDYFEELEDETYNDTGSDNALKRSVLWNDAILRSGTSISLKPGFINNALTAEDLAYVRNEFEQMPKEIQEKVILYDLVMNKWEPGEKNKSMFALFPVKVQRQINDNAEAFQKSQKDGLKTIPQRVLDDVNSILMDIEVNSDNTNLKKVFIRESKLDQMGTNRAIIQRIMEADPDLRERLVNNKSSFVFEVRTQNKKNETVKKEIYKYHPHLSGTISNDPDSFKERFKNLKRIERLGLPEIDTRLITIQDNPTTENKIPLFSEVVEESKKKRIGRAYVGNRVGTEYFHYRMFDLLSREEYDNAQKYSVPVSEFKKQQLFEKYEAVKERANTFARKLTPQYLKSLSTNELLELYNQWGNEDIVASAVVLWPVTEEATKRYSADQSRLTDRYEDGKDSAFLKSWFQANNIDSNHPATQAAARKVETEFKKFVNERKIYLREINAISNKLYKEKLGINRTGYKLIDNIQATFVLLFKNRKNVYDKLYGGIVETKFGTDREGRPIKRIRMLSDKELQAKLKAGQISATEYEFASTFKKITRELHPAKSFDFNTRGFVPAIAPNRLEALGSRGLLGMITNAKERSQAVHDVFMNYNGNKVTFKYIEDEFRNQGGNNFSKIKEYVALKAKANKLLKAGVNEDGSPIESSKVHTNTLLGQGMVNHFAGEGWVRAEDMLSMDLNKALVDFTHSSLFVTGNKNFEGFNRLQMQIDGLYNHNIAKGYNQQAKFVKGVYKEYFLKAKKETTKTDRVIDALVRGNLLYIMGWKLVAVGKGAYIVGNVIVGKYNNIKNESPINWVKGEKRFWGLNPNGPFGTRKAANVLDNLNYMDINLYDNVNIERNSGLDSIMADIAMMPMQYSERWIQGVHFLGLLTDEQWNKFDDNGNYKPGVDPLTNEEIAELENEVKNAHGKGYTPTDQRLIQQYSWGRAMMQFARFIPTMYHDRFAKEDIDIYGKQHIGSLRVVGDLVYKVASGQIAPKDIPAFRNNMTPEIRKRFDAGLKGLAMTSLAMFVGQAYNVETANELTGDANYVFNTEKLERKIFPSFARTIINLFGGLF